MATNNYWTNPLIQNQNYWSYLPYNLPLNTPQDFINYHGAQMYHTQNYMNPAMQQYYDLLDSALQSLGIPFEFETVEAFTPHQPAFRKYKIPGVWDNMPTLISPNSDTTVGGMAEIIARSYYGNRLPNLEEFVRSRIGSGDARISLDPFRQIEGSRSRELVGSENVAPYTNWFNDYLAWGSGNGIRTNVAVGPGGFTEWQTQPWNKPAFPGGAFQGYGQRGAFAGTPLTQTPTSLPSQPQQQVPIQQQAPVQQATAAAAPTQQSQPVSLGGIRVGNAARQTQAMPMTGITNERRPRQPLSAYATRTQR